MTIGHTHLWGDHGLHNITSEAYLTRLFRIIEIAILASNSRRPIMKFNNFTKEFRTGFSERQSVISDELKNLVNNSIGSLEFLQNYSGTTFNDGLYRIHKTEEIDKWNAIIGEVFPELSKLIVCFGYDWLGRHFALDLRRKKNGEPLIIMLEPGTGDALEIPRTFSTFHEKELIGYQDDALAVKFFNKWTRESGNKSLLINQCVGYKVPLFLGGRDTIENLEVSDMEVYWDICGQLLNKVRNLPPGTPVRVTISD